MSRLGVRKLSQASAFLLGLPPQPEIDRRAPRDCNLHIRTHSGSGMGMDERLGPTNLPVKCAVAPPWPGMTMAAATPFSETVECALYRKAPCATSNPQLGCRENGSGSRSGGKVRGLDRPRMPRGGEQVTGNLSQGGGLLL